MDIRTKKSDLGAPANDMASVEKTMEVNDMYIDAI